MSTVEKKRIIIADDDATTRVVVQQTLEQHGYEVITCGDGREVLSSIHVLTKPPDLFILDIGMPRMDGFATCRAIREEEERGLLQTKDGKPVPVLFITSYDTLDNRRQGFTLKSMDFMTKPVTRQSILKAVEAVLQPKDLFEGMSGLVVDDDPVVRLLVSHSLRNLGLQVLEAENGSQAFRSLQQQKKPVDLIVVDFLMDAMQGDEFFFLLRQLEDYQHVPVLAMSSGTDQDAVLTMFRHGANDYLLKPFIQEEFMARARVHLNERLYLRRLEELNADLYSLAVRDGLTGLYNRRYFIEWFERIVASHRRSGESLACLFFDIDHFKKVNDDGLVKT